MVKNRADGTLVQPTSLTVSQVLDEWLEGKRDLRPSTRRCYVDALKPVRPQPRSAPMQSLSKSDLDRWWCSCSRRVDLEARAGAPGR